MRDWLGERLSTRGLRLKPSAPGGVRMNDDLHEVPLDIVEIEIDAHVCRSSHA